MKSLSSIEIHGGVGLNPTLSAEYTNNEGNICEAVIRTKTEAEEVTVGNQPMLELYGIVECKLLDF